MATARGPHRRTHLRTYEDPVTVINSLDGRRLARLTPARAFRDAFAGAIYADEHGTYPQGTWVRAPVGSSHAPRPTDGALLYAKLGHLGASER